MYFECKWNIKLIDRDERKDCVVKNYRRLNRQTSYLLLTAILMVLVFSACVSSEDKVSEDTETELVGSNKDRLVSK